MTQIQQFSLFGNQGGGLVWQAVQTSSFTATANYAYPVNTSSGPVYVTLPASPTIGQQISITDYAGTFAGNNCIINPNGGKISGSSANAVLATSREGASIVYVDSTQGWLGYGNFVNNPVGPYTVTYLIVAGGGGGAYNLSGGGGAGGLLTGTTSFTPGAVYSIQVGSGGASGATSGQGGNGANSSITGLTTAIGGGGGGTAGSSPTFNGNAGGSGGGGGYPSGTGGSGTSGQGNAGASYTSGAGGGGGGAGGAAVNQTGGVGVASSITGVSVYYAGGGGGGTTGTGGSGGSGGGGAGGNNNLGGTAGTVNSGGGGGGGGNNFGAGSAGGSGVVIISIPTGSYTGIKTGSPTVTTNGGYTILTFTASGSYTA
jgi:hypothetical protein